MPRDKRFVNPLTRPTEQTIKTSDTFADTSTYTNTDTSTQTDTSTYTSSKGKKRKQRFEDTHERLTLWVDKHLKQSFEALAEEQDVSKTALMDEALNDLFAKYSVPEAAKAEIDRQSGQDSQ